jgi:hypothetical protein
MGRWDGKLKYLVNAVPEDFVSWLVEDAQFLGELSPNFANPDRNADALWEIFIKREPSLLHIEFQVKPLAKMGRRLWEYNVEASIKYGQPVQSVVVYLKHPGNSRAVPPYQEKLPNGKVVHDFSFSVIELCKLEAEQLFQTGLKGILPLVPLTRDGQQHDVIERVIEELQQPGVKKQEELLASTYGLAGLVFKKESDHLWLKRRFAMLEEVLEESWTFQEILEKGVEKGLKKGQLQVQRQNLIMLIQARFPALVQLAQGVCDAIQVLEELQALFQKVLLAKDELEVRQHLFSAQK